MKSFSPFLFSTLLLMAGCSTTKPLTLMTTPVIYSSAAVDPFAHLGPKDKTDFQKAITLAVPSEHFHLHDYPERVRKAAEKELNGQW